MKSIIKKIFWIVLSILILGCGSTKKVEKITNEFKEVIDSVKVTNVIRVTDTIKVYKDRIITRPVTQYIEIPIECDSVGKVKPIKYNTSSKSVNVGFEIKDGKLLFSSKIDSIVNVYEKEYRTKYVSDSLKLEERLKEKYSKQIIEETKITRYPWYWKLLMWVLGIGFIGFVVWNIYKKINPMI